MRAVFWISAALLAYAQAGYGAAARAARAPLRRAATGVRRGRRRRRVALIIAAHDEQDVIEAKVANARALDWPRLTRSSSPATAAPTRPPRAPAAAGADLVLELPRGGKIRAQDAARRAPPTPSCSPSPTPTRTWEPDALRELAPRLRRPARRLRLRPGHLHQRGRHQPGGPVLALRAVAARAGVALRLGHRGQRRDLRRAPRRLPARRPDHGPRPLAALQPRQARLAAPSTSPRRAATEKMVPSIEGEFARKRRMMGHTWPIVVRGGLRRPARLPAALRPARRLAPAAALRSRRSCTSRCWPPRRAGRGRSSPQLALLAAAATGRGRAGADRALLRAHHRVDRARPARLAAPRHRGGLGPRRGGAMTAPALRRRSSPGSRCWSPARCVLARDRRHPAGVATATRSTASGASARTASPSTSSSCARWSRAPRAWARAWRSTRATRASPASARSCAATRSTSCPTSSTSCAARWPSSARARRSPCRSSSTRRASAGAWPSSPGITGWAQVNGRASLPWSERIELDLWYIEHRSWRLDLQDPARALRAMVLHGAGLYKGATGGWDRG